MIILATTQESTVQYISSTLPTQATPYSLGPLEEIFQIQKREPPETSISKMQRNATVKMAKKNAKKWKQNSLRTGKNRSYDLKLQSQLERYRKIKLEVQRHSVK